MGRKFKVFAVLILSGLHLEPSRVQGCSNLFVSARSAVVPDLGSLPFRSFEDQLGRDHKVFWIADHLPQPVFNCVDAARARGIPLHREIKTIVFRTKRKTDRRFYVFHLPANLKIDISKVRELGIPQLRRASAEDILAVTGVALESGLFNPIKLYEQLPDDTVYFVSNRFGEKVLYTTNDNTHVGTEIYRGGLLLNLPRASVGDFVEVN